MSLVRDLFRPKVNLPEAPQAPPTIDEAARAQDQTDRIKRRRGFASTIVVPNAPTTGAAAVLGG